MAASSVDQYSGFSGIEFQPNFSFCSLMGIEAISASHSGGSFGMRGRGAGDE